MTSTSASRRAITTDVCRTNNTTGFTRRSARSSSVPALRSGRIRRDVLPSSWGRPASTAIRRNSPARSRNRISPLSRESCDKGPRFNIRRRTVTTDSTTLPSRRSWPTTDSTIPNSYFSMLSAPRTRRNTTFGTRFSRRWCGN